MTHKTPSSPPEQLAGTVLRGKYRLEHVLGAGGMGVVYRGHHLQLNRPVAVKLIHRKCARNLKAVRRFLREAQSAASLDHQSVVRVLDVDRCPDGAVYMVLELLSGEPLRTWIDRAGQLSWSEAFTILEPLMEALASAHDKGIVHRDLKPENLFVARSPSGAIRPKVLDFGVAKLSHDLEGTLTTAGMIVGTPMYMPPEQLMGEPGVGPAADVWAMGVVLYETLTGRLPFDFGRSAKLEPVVAAILADEPHPIARFRPDLPPAIAQVIDRALTKDRGVRYATMGQFVAELRAAAVAATAAAEPAKPAAASSPKRGARTPRPIGALAGLAVAVLSSVLAVVQLTGAASPADEPAPVAKGVIHEAEARWAKAGVPTPPKAPGRS